MKSLYIVTIQSHPYFKKIDQQTLYPYILFLHFCSDATDCALVFLAFMIMEAALLMEAAALLEETKRELFLFFLYLSTNMTI